VVDDTDAPRGTNPKLNANAQARRNPDAPKRGPARREPKLRWECRCSEPPILLARYDAGGQVQIKVRDRFYIASGCVYATCPRCGAQHVLDLRSNEGDDDTPLPNTPSGWR
jgi:hypothetical protein